MFLDNFRVLRTSSGFRVVFGAVTSRLATLGFNAAMAVYVLDLTGNAVDLGLTLFVGTVPFFALSLVTGVVCDRFSRKNIILVCDAIRVLVAAGFLVASTLVDTGSTILLVYATVFLFSLCESFVSTAFSTIVPDVVEEKHILDTNNLVSGLGEAVRMGGPVAGVLIYAVAGFHTTTLFVMALFIVAFCLQWGIGYVKVNAPGTTTGIGAMFRQEAGMFRQLITGDARLSSLFANGFTTHLFLYPFALIGLPYVITQVFRANSIEYGYLEAVCALGGILAVLVVPFTKGWTVARNLSGSMVGMLAGSALFLLLLIGPVADLMGDNAVVRLGVLSLACFTVFLAFGVYGVYFVSFMHENIRSEMLGKGMSVVMMCNALGRMLGFWLFGLLFDHSLQVAVLVFVSGMALKLLVHVPFLIADRKRTELAQASKGEV
ncbi:MFS transporter [Nocardiopsis alba]|uniref:MFS transporter n=1 Tax=Nocardiopsis alba TaxID=53437 RepID=UPI0033B66EF8